MPFLKLWQRLYKAMEELSQDYTEIQNMVDQLLPQQWTISFEHLVKQLVTGETGGIFQILEQFGRWMISGMLKPLEHGAHMFAILLFSALITNVSKAFSKSQVSHVGYLCVYLLFTVYAAAGFRDMLAVAGDGVSSLCRFIEVLLPAYCMCLAFVTGSLTATACYSKTVFFLGLLEEVVRYLLLPAVQAYFIIGFASCMQKKPMFCRLLDLLETIIGWVRKTMLGLVLATGAVQSLLLPAIDRVKRNAMIKTAAAIPGVGDLMGGALETVLSAGTVLKNSIGLAGAVLIFILCSVPLVKLGMGCLIYQGLAAIAEPIAEEPMEQFIVHIKTAHQLLFQILMLSMLLFLLMLVIMTGITGV